MAQRRCRNGTIKNKSKEAECSEVGLFFLNENVHFQTMDWNACRSTQEGVSVKINFHTP